MKICKGEISGVKCKHFDEDFEVCTHPNRSTIIRAIENCKDYERESFPTAKTSEPMIADELVDIYLNELESADEAEQQAYQNFIGLPKDEQLYVYYTTVEEMSGIDALQKILPDVERRLLKKRVYMYNSRPRIIKAMNELSKTSTAGMIEVLGMRTAKKLMKATEKAVDNMIGDYEGEHRDENGNLIVRHHDIIMANKLHAETVMKYKNGNSELGSGGAIITFGNGETLKEMIGTLNRLPEKVVENEDEKGQ